MASSATSRRPPSLRNGRLRRASVVSKDTTTSAQPGSVTMERTSSPKRTTVVTAPPRWAMPWISDTLTTRPAAMAARAGMRASTEPCPPTPHRRTVVALLMRAAFFRCRSARVSEVFPGVRDRLGAAGSRSVGSPAVRQSGGTYDGVRRRSTGRSWPHPMHRPGVDGRPSRSRRPSRWPGSPASCTRRRPCRRRRPHKAASRAPRSSSTHAASGTQHGRAHRRPRPPSERRSARPSGRRDRPCARPPRRARTRRPPNPARGSAASATSRR